MYLTHEFVHDHQLWTNNMKILIWPGILRPSDHSDFYEANWKEVPTEGIVVTLGGISPFPSHTCPFSHKYDESILTASPGSVPGCMSFCQRLQSG